MKKKVGVIARDIFFIFFAFILIILVFFGVSFGYSKLKSITGDSIQEGSSVIPSYVEWIVITLISALLIVEALEIAVKKRTFKINWNLASKPKAGVSNYAFF